MRITRETDYAIRCVLHLSRTPDHAVLLQEIVGARSIPKSFLPKILRKLAKEKIVKSFRGAKGGTQLARRPEEITLLEVIEAIEGPVTLNDCAVDSRICTLSDTCSVHPVWKTMREDLKGLLRRHTFSSLLDMEKQSGHVKDL